jgi:DedD protein
MTTDIERGGIDVGGSHEPSYYEIALTNRQVVVAFVILLTCVVAAFFSGVWIGRESAARAQERLALLGRGRAADGANLDADKGKQEGQALQEFKFFADSRQRPAAAKDHSAAKERPAAARVDRATKGAAGSPSDGSTLADDLHHAGSSAGPEGNATSTAATSPPSAVKRSQRGSQASFPPQAAKASPATPAPADSEPAGEGEPLPGTPHPAARSSRANARSGSGAATSGGGKPSISWSAAGAGASSTGTGASTAGAGAKPSAAASSAAAGEVVIQVFSTADKEQADKVRDGLVHGGFTAFLSPIAKGGQTMYRVRIGPFSSRTAAEPVAEKVRKERKLDTWITPK